MAHSSRQVVKNLDLFIDGHGVFGRVAINRHRARISLSVGSCSMTNTRSSNAVRIALECLDNETFEMKMIPLPTRAT